MLIHTKYNLLGFGKTAKKHHTKMLLDSDEWTGLFRPIAAQFTLIKTDQNANVKWGVRFYRD